MNILITGSTRGLGGALAEFFLSNGHKVVINGTSNYSVSEAMSKLFPLYGKNVLGYTADIADAQDIESMFIKALDVFGNIDIVIANAGINQPNKLFYQLTADEIRKVITVNLEGMMNTCGISINHMEKGHIYTMEGYGSNDMITKGMTLYGTSKRALTYFTKSLAKECEDTNIKIGLLSPGMVATDFIKEEATKENSSTSKVFSILADKPETVAEFLGKKILSNKKNNTHIKWLTNIKAAYRFMTAAKQKKRKLF